MYIGEMRSYQYSVRAAKGPYPNAFCCTVRIIADAVGGITYITGITTIPSVDKPALPVAFKPYWCSYNVLMLLSIYIRITSYFGHTRMV